MSSNYCLVTSDTETKFARDIINSRLKEKKYPLYKKTPFLNEIKKNDEVVFYLAGTGENSQSFVASASQTPQSSLAAVPPTTPAQSVVSVGFSHPTISNSISRSFFI